MADLSIEYSLNSPVFLNNDILSKKIFDLARNNNMNGGGFGLDMSNCISLLIGIVIIIIGFVLLSFKNDLVESEAIIRTQTCDVNSENSENSENSQNSQCKINITYTVDSIQYSKIITLNKNNIPDAPTIKIYYQMSNPSSIQLYNFNYSIIGIGMIIIGIFIMIFSIGGISKGKTNDVSGSSKSINIGSNLYSNTSNNDGFNIVYSE